MKKECAHCGNKFEPTSGKQRFCSDRCRMAFSRNKNKEVPADTPDHEKMLRALMEDPAALSVLLLKHPRPDMVRSCCLHYLGDGYQLIDGFLLANGWTPQDLLAAVQKKPSKEKERVTQERLDKTTGYDPFKNPRAMAAMGKTHHNDKKE